MATYSIKTTENQRSCFQLAGISYDETSDTIQLYNSLGKVDTFSFESNISVLTISFMENNRMYYLAATKYCSPHSNYISVYDSCMAERRPFEHLKELYNLIESRYSYL